MYICFQTSKMLSFIHSALSSEKAPKNYGNMTTLSLLRKGKIIKKLKSLK